MSHEEASSESEAAGVTRALVPCGGKGTRMLALTGGAPKEMIRVAGVPLVVGVAAECAASGVTELLVVMRGSFLDVGIPHGFVEAESLLTGSR